MKTSDKIVNYINQQQQASTGELVDLLGITDRAVRKQLKALLEKGVIKKNGKPPKVFYSVAVKDTKKRQKNNIPIEIQEVIERNFLYVSPAGIETSGFEGFMLWCEQRDLNADKMASQYNDAIEKYRSYSKNGIISAIDKITDTFDDVALDELYYADFYSIEIFGKTKLGQRLLYAKQSQDRALINLIADSVKPKIDQLIKEYKIDAVGFIPPTVKRELQFMRHLEKQLHLNVRKINIVKIKTPVIVPQKSLSKLKDRVINAKETLNIENTHRCKNLLLIDDATGSGSTLNEVAKKARDRGICEGNIIGFTVTGSVKGFDIISEV